MALYPLLHFDKLSSLARGVVVVDPEEGEGLSSTIPDIENERMSRGYVDDTCVPPPKAIPSTVFCDRPTQRDRLHENGRSERDGGHLCVQRGGPSPWAGHCAGVGLGTRVRLNCRNKAC